MLTVYKVKGRDQGLEFIFKYDLNGILVSFEKNQELVGKQITWLYSERFPEKEEQMQNYWIADPSMRKKFIVERAPANLDFESLWNLYDYKVSKQDAMKQFNKLKEIDVIKCFSSLKNYEDYLIRTKIAKAHLSTYINRRYFDNEY